MGIPPEVFFVMSVSFITSASVVARYSLHVIAGLDPAIHPFRKMMDARVKPAHDELENSRMTISKR
jgi:hypothetical protein